MIIVDTGVWIDALKIPNEPLAALMLDIRVLLHPFVAGEISLGSLPRREAYLRELRKLPRAPVARHYEVARIIDAEQLHSTGIGYVDAHLIASCRLLTGARLWTGDKRLHAQAERLGVAYAP